MANAYDDSVNKVAEEIEKHRQEIIDRFQAKLRERVELPEDAEEKIKNLIPVQLDNLIKTLVNHSISKRSVYSLAGEHAKLKGGTKHFTLDILISEFLVLRDVIFEILEKVGPVDLKASNIIWQFIVHSIKISVIEFERERIKESVKVHQDLDDSETINRTISQQIIESNENEERFRTLVEGVEDYAIFTVDSDGVILSWNPGAEKMKGYTYREAIGSHFSMLYPEDAQKRDEPMHHLHTALIEGRYRGEGLRRRKNGEIFLADVYIRPVYKNNKHLGFAKVVADLTNRNELMNEANISNSVIVDLKSEKDQREKFVLTLSHDLRGPLSVARAAVELLGRSLDSNNTSRKFVDKAIISMDRLNRMIGNLLDANRMAGGENPKLKIQNWDIVRLARNVCDDFAVLGSEINFQSDKPQIIGEWDGEEVRRVFENLLSNAIKYGDNDYPVDMDVLDLGDQVCVKVHNMGELIKEDDQKSLFDQFRRAESTKTPRGWGIGLSLVKGITEAHGGSVIVESFETEGTTFTVNLPKQFKEKKATP